MYAANADPARNILSSLLLMEAAEPEDGLSFVAGPHLKRSTAIMADCMADCTEQQCHWWQGGQPDLLVEEGNGCVVGKGCRL